MTLSLMQTAIQLGKKDNTADAKTGEIEGHVRRTNKQVLRLAKRVCHLFWKIKFQEFSRTILAFSRSRNVKWSEQMSGF